MDTIKANDLKPGAVISGIWKGVHGSGKTIASCGKMFRPVLVLDFEHRYRSIVNYYRKLDGHCNDVDFRTFTMGGNFYAVNTVFDELKRYCPYKSVSCASLTSYIHYVLKGVIESKAGKSRSSGQGAGKFIGGIPTTELEDFNAEDAAIIFELMEFFQAIQEQGVNVFLEAHISPYNLRKKDGTSETVMQILTKGNKAPAQIPGYFDEMYLFKKVYEGGYIEGSEKTAKYLISTAGDEFNDTKTGLGIKGFDWTDKDFSEELYKQIPQEVQDAPRVDPNKPEVINFG